MSKPILAWHFVSDDGKLRNPVNGITHVEPGLVLERKGKIHMCVSGLHASRKLLDALQFAHGALLCRVRCSGDVIENHDKLVCSQREILWTLDATDYLHEFACQAAEYAIKRSGVKPDPCSVAAIKAKRDWLAGKISDKKLEAAWAAARNVSGPAAWAAMWAAARGAAAGGDVWDSALAATQDAAWGAGWNTLNNTLTRIVMAAELETDDE